MGKNQTVTADDLTNLDGIVDWTHSLRALDERIRSHIVLDSHVGMSTQIEAAKRLCALGAAATSAGHALILSMQAGLDRSELRARLEREAKPNADAAYAGLDPETLSSRHRASVEGHGMRQGEAGGVHRPENGAAEIEQPESGRKIITYRAGNPDVDRMTDPPEGWKWQKRRFGHARAKWVDAPEASDPVYRDRHEKIYSFAIVEV